MDSIELDFNFDKSSRWRWLAVALADATIAGVTALLLNHYLTTGIYNMYNFKHIIEIDPIKNTLIISRFFEDGVIDFLTETRLPEIGNGESDMAPFNDFALMLGQNILLDSSYIRDKLKV